MYTYLWVCTWHPSPPHTLVLTHSHSVIHPWHSGAPCRAWWYRTCRFLLNECDKGCEKETGQLLGEFKGGERWCREGFKEDKTFGGSFGKWVGWNRPRWLSLQEWMEGGAKWMDNLTEQTQMVPEKWWVTGLSRIWGWGREGGLEREWPKLDLILNPREVLMRA